MVEYILIIININNIKMLLLFITNCTKFTIYINLHILYI